MVKINIIFIGLVLIIALFQRCKTESDDEQKPSFTLSSENTISNDTVFLNHTEGFSFDLDIQDDLELQSLRVFTSQVLEDDAFSCKIPLEAFGDLLISDLSGETASFQYQVDFPDSLSGRFSTSIQVLDAVGNTYLEKYILELSNAARPFIDSLVFNATDSLCTLINLDANTELVTTVYARNEEGINQVHLYWFSEEDLLLDQNFSFTPASSISETVNISVPALLETETLTLKVKVTSVSGSSNWASYQVQGN